MTRDEEIKDALNMYAPSVWDVWGETVPMNKDELAASHEGFIRGARWADKNPKSPWINVEDDLPCNHDDMIYFGTTCRVLVKIKDDICITCMKKYHDEWKWAINKTITYWMPIPKIKED